MALIRKTGYGQVEPNHLSAQRTGQIYAQLPLDASFGSGEVLENGTFMKYDMAAGKVNTSGSGEFLLVFNEVKLYDKAKQGYKDFALKVDEAVSGVVTPRLFKVNDGDIFTTNMASVSSTAGTIVGKLLVPTVTGDVGILTETTTYSTASDVYQVVKYTTMPDGQVGIKVQKLFKAVAAV